MSYQKGWKIHSFIHGHRVWFHFLTFTRAPSCAPSGSHSAPCIRVFATFDRVRASAQVCTSAMDPALSEPLERGTHTMIHIIFIYLYNIPLAKKEQRTISSSQYFDLVTSLPQGGLSFIILYPWIQRDRLKTNSSEMKFCLKLNDSSIYLYIYIYYNTHFSWILILLYILVLLN